MGIMKQKFLEESHMDDLVEEAAERLFITGNYFRNDFNKEQRELIEARAAVMSDDWNAGNFPGWRD